MQVLLSVHLCSGAPLGFTCAVKCLLSKKGVVLLFLGGATKRSNFLLQTYYKMPEFALLDYLGVQQPPQPTPAAGGHSDSAARIVVPRFKAPPPNFDGRKGGEPRSCARSQSVQAAQTPTPPTVALPPGATPTGEIIRRPLRGGGVIEYVVYNSAAPQHLGRQPEGGARTPKAETAREGDGAPNQHAKRLDGLQRRGRGAARCA